MDKQLQAQLLADKIQLLLMLVDNLMEDLSDEDIDLLEESKETLLDHISMQHSAITLTSAFGMNTDTTEEEFKAKTLDKLIALIKVRREYKDALIEKKEEQENIQKNREELTRIFGNM